MINFVGEHKTCDTKQANGDMFFYEDHLEWVPRFFKNRRKSIVIKYSEITKVGGTGLSCSPSSRGTKGWLNIYVGKTLYDFRVYHVGDFVEIIEEGMRRAKSVENKGE